MVLCHESCEDTGSCFEVGAGWVARVRRQRSEGVYVNPQSLTPEKMMEVLPKSKEFKDPSYPTSPADSTATVITLMQSKL